MSLGRTERGAAVVEFAIVLPFLVMFVFGIIEFGRGYSARIQLTSAVREGARAAALGEDEVAATKKGAPGLDPNLMTVTTTGGKCPNTATPAPTTTTTTVGTTTTTTTTIPYATVKATYPFTYTIPFVGTQTKDLTATGVMRCGG